MPLTRPLERPHFRRAHLALHAAWSMAANNASYDKKAWLELEAAIENLALNGPGAPNCELCGQLLPGPGGG